MSIFSKGSLCVAIILGCSPASYTQTVDRDDGRQLIEDFLNNVVTMTGRFEQQLVGADDELIEASTGTLDIHRPGQFRWSYFDPYQQILIADGLNIWSYDVDLEQVTVKNQTTSLSSTPAVLLGGSNDVWNDFDYVESFADRGTVWVRLRPKDTDSDFNQVELGFTDRKLTRMLFADNLEQTTLIALFDVIVNEPIDAAHFAFEPPAGVDVVGTPIIADSVDQ